MAVSSYVILKIRNMLVIWTKKMLIWNFYLIYFQFLSEIDPIHFGTPLWVGRDHPLVQYRAWRHVRSSYFSALVIVRSPRQPLKKRTKITNLFIRQSERAIQFYATVTQKRISFPPSWVTSGQDVACEKEHYSKKPINERSFSIQSKIRGSFKLKI